MAGRSNLQQAVPLTFGFKCACLLAAFQRHRQRLKELRPRVLAGEFGGAVVGCFLGLVTSTCGKVSMDVKLLMQTEVAEVYEPFHEGRGSSSTMPQKRNPISSLYIHANAAVVRQHVAALLEAAVADHERSTGPWEIEWISLPEIFLLSAGCLRQTRDMLAGLEVDAARMRANLDMTHGAVVSEAVMMGLGPHLGRQRAHDLVYDICRVAANENKPLVDLLAQDKDIAKHVSRAELEQMCDPANYLGLAGEMVDRVLKAEGARKQ
jgi:3-carboxy-cis,cis-muconate cycloisomerase